MSPVVTAIDMRGKGVAAVTLDGGDAPALLALDTVVLHRLAEGDDLSDDGWRSIREEGRRLLAVRQALGLVGRKRRTEHELRAALRRAFSEPEIEAAIERVHALGYLDDTTIAQDYVAHRRAASRGSALLRHELRARGLDMAAVGEALDGRDDTAPALALARERARALSTLDGPTARRRLYDYLRRRGFDDEVSRRAVEAALGVVAE